VPTPCGGDLGEEADRPPEGAALRDGAEFVLGDVPLGARVGVIVRPKDYAPVLLGPIDTTAARHEVVARVVPFAQVTCRVVDAGGAPVFGIRVGAREVEPVPGGPFWSAIATDQQGERRFTGFPPGRTRFSAWSEGDELASVEVDLRPGPNTDVVLTVAR
jgi:hypothetical protein